MENQESKNRSLINRFLNKRIEKKETADFVRKMAEEDFSEAALNETVRQFGRGAMKDKLEDVHQEMLLEKQSYKKRIGVTLVLLLVALLIGVWGYQKYQSEQIPATPQQIYANYFEPYPVVNFRGEKEDPKEIEKAIDAYGNENYAKAIVLFDAILENPSSTYPSYFYNGLSNLAVGNSQAAIDALEVVLTTDNDLQETAQWYIALAYLQQDDIAKARSVLQLLSANENNAYQSKAVKILSELPDSINQEN